MTGLASTQSVVVNLTKTMIGAGILALPFAYRAQGLLLATATILLAAATTGLGLWFQSYCSGFLPHGHASFFNVSKITYPALAVVFDAAIAIKTFGVSVSYLVLIGNLSPLVAAYFGATGLLLTRTFWLVVALLIAGPLTFLRTLDALKYTSVVALVSAGYVILLVVFTYLFGDTEPARGPISIVEPKGVTAVLQSFPIIVFAYTAAHNMFSALNELSTNTLPTIQLIIASVLSITSTLYILTGAVGYLSFGDNVTDNIISMYEQGVLSTLGRLAIVVLVLFSFPVQLHPCRVSLLNIWSAISRKDHNLSAGVGVAGRGPGGDAVVDNYAGSGDGTAHTPLDNETSPLLDGTNPHTATPLAPLADETSATQFNLVTVALLVVGFAIAVSVESLELVLSFVGSTGATAISFILPGVFAYSLAGSTLENRLVRFRPAAKRRIQYAAVALGFWGVVVFVLCLGSNILRFFV